MARGISARQLRTLISSGDLVRLRHGLYATKPAMEWSAGDPRRSHLLYVRAALDTIGRSRSPVASFQSAAVMHNFDLLKHPGETVTLTMAPGQRIGARAGGVIVHSAALPRAQRFVMDRIPVTNPARTVADLARTLPFAEAVVVADSALHHDVASQSEVRAVLEGCASWPGSRRAQRAIGFADGGAESVLESCGRVLLAEYFTETPVVQYSIEVPGLRYHVDLYYARYKTIVEFDGMVKYDEKKDIRDQFQRDRVLRDAGYKIVHVTWDEIFRTPEVAIERVRRAFAAPSPF
ncbi:MAG: DUF559 domain-containing protein [Trebonia sp.]